MTAGGVFTWIRPTRIASTQDSALGAILDFVFWDFVLRDFAPRDGIGSGSSASRHSGSVLPAVPRTASGVAAP